MFRVACIIAFVLALAACASPFPSAGLGRINRPIDTVWVGSDKFVYVPGRDKNWNFVFETAKGRIIEPGMMYTDGGSIPRIAQIFKGFSPWGFGPAYIVHDWIFFAHHCDIDRTPERERKYRDITRFQDVYAYGGYKEIEFHESATILAEVVKTIIDHGYVQPQNVPATVISSAVDSVFALALWNEPGACDRHRVHPRHIAIIWVRLNGGIGEPPATWKLSPAEIEEAKTWLPWARDAVRTLQPLKYQPGITQGDLIAAAQ